MKLLLILTTILLLVVVVTASNLAGRTALVEDVSTNAIPPLEVPPNLGQSDEAGPEVKLVLLALLPHGFENAEMLLEPSDYLFIISNRTGLQEVNFRIDREGKSASLRVRHAVDKEWPRTVHYSRSIDGECKYGGSTNIQSV